MSSRSSNNHPLRPPEIPGWHCVGRVRGGHGIRGEISVTLRSKSADWLSDKFTAWLLAHPTEASDRRELKPLGAKPHKEGLRARLPAIQDRNQADALKGFWLFIPVAALSAPEGEPVFLKQIDGFMLRAPDGRELGRIYGFASNGPQDLLRVRTHPEGPEYLVPFVDPFIVRIDLAGQAVVMDLPEGLLGESE